MKKALSLVFVVIFFSVLTSCIPERVVIFDITEERFITETQKLDETGEEYLIIDIRSAMDYKLGHIKGSINIPTGQLYLRTDELKTIDARTVFLVGNETEATYLAAKTFARIGFRKIFNLPSLSELTYEDERISPILPVTFVLWAKKEYALVIDYRPTTVYEVGHYPNCIQVRYNQDENDLINRIPWARSYYIYSHTPEVAHSLGVKLEELGYRNIHYLNAKTVELDNYLTERTPEVERTEQQYEFTTASYRHADWE